MQLQTKHIQRERGARPGVERIALAVVAIYTLAYVSWTAFHWWGDREVLSGLGAWVILAAAIALTARRAVQAVGHVRWAWACISLGCAAWLAGDAIWFYLSVIREVDSFPSVADPLYLAFYPLVFTGLVLMPVEKPRPRDRLTLVLDTATVMVAGLMIVWYLVIEPTIAEAGSSLLAEALALAYPVGDLVLLLGLARLLFRGPRYAALPSLWLLGVGLTAMVVGDVSFAHLDLGGSVTAGSFPDAAYAVAGFLVMLAAYVADIGGLRRSNAVGRTREVTVAPFLALFAGLGLLVYRAASPGAGSLVALTAGVCALAGLIVLRQVTLQRDVQALVHELSELVRTDVLTGLASRREFFERGQEMVRTANQSGSPCAVILGDLDSFKTVNDEHGHAMGDRVLRLVADCCRACADSRDMVARLGGDELAWILPETDEAGATSFAAALTARIAAEASATVPGVPVSVSLGVAVSGGAAELDELLLAADSDLYRAKNARRAPAQDHRELRTQRRWAE